jgi:ABC-type amino acid transport substrate-binding protein
VRLPIVLILIMFVLPGYADDRIIIIPEVPRYYQKAGNGSYQILMREILRRSGESATLESFPPSRATVMFDRFKNACYPVSLKLASYVLGYPLIASGETINRFKIVIATLRGTAMVTSFDQIRGQSIAALQTANLAAYGDSLSLLTVRYVNSHEQGLKLLKAGKVSAILGSVGDLVTYKDQLNYEDADPIYADDERIVCHPGPEAKGFLQKIDRAIRSMKADGSLKSILGVYYLVDE